MLVCGSRSFTWLRSLPLISRSFANTMATLQKDTNQDDVLFEIKKNTEFITLNRPDQLNTLNLSMIRKITPNYRKYLISDNQNVHTFVLKGTGEKAFCAGGDIKGMIQGEMISIPIYQRS